MLDLLRHPFAWLLGYRQIPFAARAIFRHELRHVMSWGVVWGTLHGGFCGYVALKCFQASDVLVSIIAAAMAFANLFAMYWAALAGRMPKKRALQFALWGTAIGLASFVLTPWCDVFGPDTVPRWFLQLSAPRQPVTAAVFTAQIVLLWIVLQGTNTLRTSIWKNNYPPAARGRILARLAIWQIMVGAVWVACMAAYLDGAGHFDFMNHAWHWDLRWLSGAGTPNAYRNVFLLAALACILSIILYAPIKVRSDHHFDAAPVIRADGADLGEPTFATPGWFSTRWNLFRGGVHEARHTLRHDAVFRHYMGWMFLSGSAVMLIQVPLVLILKHKFDMSYLTAAGVLTFIPQVALVLTTPLWARFFDHWSLFLYRSVQIGLWTISRALLAAGVAGNSLGLVTASVILSGAALGGGRFAWHLGHMGFSTVANDRVYLGIHQTLTGIRGLTMPFLGAALYRYIFDWHIIWISAVLLAISVIGYYRMHARNPRATAR